MRVYERGILSAQTTQAEQEQFFSDIKELMACCSSSKETFEFLCGQLFSAEKENNPLWPEAIQRICNFYEEPKTRYLVKEVIFEESYKQYVFTPESKFCTTFSLVEMYGWIYAQALGEGDKVLDLSEEVLSEDDFFSGEKWRIFVLALEGSRFTALDLSEYDSSLVLKQGFWVGLKNSSIKKLFLSENGLGSLSTDQWKHFWEGLNGSNVEELELEGNDLEVLTNEEWAEFCRGMAKSRIISLNLCASDLFILFDREEKNWSEFCAALWRSEITNLDFGENCLTEEQCQQLKHILDSNREIQPNLLGSSFFPYSIFEKHAVLPHAPKIPIVFGLSKRNSA